jgi:hypothetical protein
MSAELVPRQLDEIWEMNMHLNPLDDETKKTLQKHQQQLAADDFSAYVKHHENQRLKNIDDEIFKKKLDDFTNNGELLDQYFNMHKSPKSSKNPMSILKSGRKIMQSRNEMKNVVSSNNTDKNSVRSVSTSFLIKEQEEEGKVLDLSDFCKSTIPVNPNPDRLACIMSEYSLAQKNPKRWYLQALPAHVKEKEDYTKKIERKVPERVVDKVID